MHGKAAMCRMGKTVRAGVSRCPRFSLANREYGIIGNKDAPSFLNGATVDYDESRVSAKAADETDSPHPRKPFAPGQRRQRPGKFGKKPRGATLGRKAYSESR